LCSQSDQAATAGAKSRAIAMDAGEETVPLEKLYDRTDYERNTNDT
jgi:hypothetical protein